MVTEAGPEAYNEVYSGQGVYSLDPTTSLYYPVYRRVVECVRARQPTSVLEVGSGSGSLADLLTRSVPARYRGFDFSEIAVQKARARLGQPDLFSVGDAREPGIYAAAPFDLVVCMEVLEHIEADREVVGLWPSGVQVVATVPNFPDRTHVRVFRSEADVRDRYGDLIDIETIDRRARSVMGGHTLRSWAQHLIWKRSDPKRFLGHLGINRFNWGYGWFIFCGRRR